MKALPLLLAANKRQRQLEGYVVEMERHFTSVLRHATKDGSEPAGQHHLAVLQAWEVLQGATNLLNRWRATCGLLAGVANSVTRLEEQRRGPRGETTCWRRLYILASRTPAGAEAVLELAAATLMASGRPSLQRAATSVPVDSYKLCRLLDTRAVPVPEDTIQRIGVLRDLWQSVAAARQQETPKPASHIEGSRAHSNSAWMELATALARRRVH